jgi:hypothetical protein
MGPLARALPARAKFIKPVSLQALISLNRAAIGHFFAILAR